ncbi:MAG: ABC transporter permease [Bifidobacteriaceae bacterium]|jgi:ABC-2 type transport system permease protein|nr:ABC transporter permease [Bifidobacteriaceae bacterium]
MSTAYPAYGAPRALPAVHRPPYRLSFAGALAGEWVKLRTMRFTWWSTVILVVASVGLAAMLALSAAGWVHSGVAGAAEFEGWRGVVRVNQAPALIGTVIALVLGVLAVTSEYSSSSIKAALTATPRRGQLFVAKALAVALVVGVAGAVSVALALLVNSAILRGVGVDGSMEAAGWLAAGGVVVFLVAVALVGVGLGFLLRSSAGGIALGLALFLAINMMAGFLATVSPLAGALWDITPSAAGSVLWGGPALGDSVLGSHGAAAAVLGVWVLAALGAGFMVFRSRDA